MQRFILEKSKVFPYVAWITILVFTVFVFNLTLNLQSAVTDLQQSTDALEAAVQALPHTTSTTTKTAS